MVYARLILLGRGQPPLMLRTFPPCVAIHLWCSVTALPAGENGNWKCRLGWVAPAERVRIAEATEIVVGASADSIRWLRGHDDALSFRFERLGFILVILNPLGVKLVSVLINCEIQGALIYGKVEVDVQENYRGGENQKRKRPENQAMHNPRNPIFKHFGLKGNFP